MLKVHPIESSLGDKAEVEEKDDVKSDIFKAERNSPVSIELRNTESQDVNPEHEDSKSETELVVTLCESPHRLVGLKLT